MSATLQDIAAQIIANLRTTDPDLDTSIGTTTRKIIDAVSEQIAEAYVDQQLVTYQYDIDSKSDAALDDFVQLFGMARLAAKRASGIVVFSRASNLSSSVTIPVNTQIASNTNPSVVVQTVTGAYMDVGVSQVSVPVQAVVAGSAGNVPAGTLVTINTPVSGVSAVTNPDGLSGGLDQEGDLALRARWKKTVFRSLAGTEQMYLGVALDDPDCYIANVLGAAKHRREQVQIVSGKAVTTVADARFVYPSPVFVGQDVDAGDIYLPDADYTWNTSVNPPEIDVINATAIPDGTIVEVDFQYEPQWSRNDVQGGITNRVDIWCGGSRARSATQVIGFRQANRFTATATDTLYTGNFVAEDDTNPTANNVFVPLAFGPVLTVPSSLTINGVIYAEATPESPLGSTGTVGGQTVYSAYRIVHQGGAPGYTPTSYFGLEWSSAFLPPNDSVFTIGDDGDYTYNSMVTDIQLAIDRWRLLGVDAKVHAAKQVFLKFNLAIMYSPSVAPETVDTQIDNALATFLLQTDFETSVQVSDILQIVHNVVGVDNVRFLNGTDYGAYNGATPNAYAVGIQRVVAGTVIDSYVDSTGRPMDVHFGDGEVPVFDSTYLVTKAQNSFGVA